MADIAQPVVMIWNRVEDVQSNTEWFGQTEWYGPRYVNVLAYGQVDVFPPFKRGQYIPTCGGRDAQTLD
jgi:hypothetical protein